MPFTNEDLYAGLAERFEGNRPRTLSGDDAKQLWVTAGALLCFQLVGSIHKGSEMGNRRPPRPGTSAMRQAPLRGTRIAFPKLGHFVQLDGPSYSTLPHVAFIASDVFCETYGCRSQSTGWRVSGAIRTHDLNARELARRLNRTTDEISRFLQGAVALLGERCETGDTVSVVFPSVGELRAERRMVRFEFKLEPDPHFCASAETSQNRAAPCSRLPSTAAAAAGSAAHSEVAHAKQISSAAAADCGASALAAAVQATLDSAVRGSDAPELRRHCAPAMSAATPPAHPARPSTACSTGTISSVGRSFVGDGGVDGAPCSTHGGPSLASLGGRFAEAKARRHRVGDELCFLQRQAMERLALQGVHARPASSASSRSSAVSPSLLSAGSALRCRSHMARQPSPFAVERVYEAACSRHREAIMRAKAEEERLCGEAHRRELVANLADTIHQQEVRAHQAEVVATLQRQVSERASAAPTPLASIARSRDRETAAIECAASSVGWSAAPTRQQRRESAQQYRRALDRQVAAKRAAHTAETELEHRLDSDSCALSMAEAIEQIKRERLQRRATVDEAQRALSDQLELSHLKGDRILKLV